MTEEGTITPEIQINQLEDSLATETDRLKKLFAAYEAQEKELVDTRAEIEVLEKEIIDKEIEREAQESLIAEKDFRIRELEMKATKADKRVEHLQPALQTMEEKYSREKDRLGKVFGIAEELDNDLKLAVTEMKARDDWYVSHMTLFEDLNKAIKERYEMIERAVESERQSQHMSRAFTERMDEMVEARAEEMTNQEPEAPAEEADEPEEAPSEETVEETEEESTEETPEESVEEEVAETSEEPATWNADVDPWADN